MSLAVKEANEGAVKSNEENKEQSQGIPMPKGVEKEISKEEEKPAFDPASEALKRVAEEKKAIEAELQALREEKAARERAAKESTLQDLEKRAEWEKLAKIRQEELEAYKAKEAERERKEKESVAKAHEALKFSAVLAGLNGKIEREYLPLVDKLINEMVAIDPETGQPDPVAVRNAQTAIETKYGKIISSREVRFPPSNAAKGGSIDLTSEISSAKNMNDLAAILRRNGKKLS